MKARIFKVVFLWVLSGSLTVLMHAQSSEPSPTPPSAEATDDVECGLIRPEIVKVRVSVWDRKTNDYVSSLDWRNFEILEGDQVFEVEYFIPPGKTVDGERRKNEYTLGFTPSDLRRKKWRNLRVRLKSVNAQSLSIRLTPNKYFY